MPRMSTMWLNSYVSDIYTQDQPLRFKIKDGAPGIPQMAYSSVVPVGANTICAPSSLFSPRYFRVQHTDGQVIQYPIGNRDNIQALAAALIASGTVLCLDLVGEKWRSVPYGIIGGGPPVSLNNPYVPVGGTGKARKVTGTADYTSDVLSLGTLQLKFAYEEIPATISNAFRGCHVNEQVGQTRAICPISAAPIRPRHWIAIHSVSPTAAPPITGTLRRKGMVSNRDRGDIRQCGVDVSTVTGCLAYQGESIRNLHLLVAGTPLLPPGP